MNPTKEVRHEVTAMLGMSAAGRVGARPATWALVHLLMAWGWALVCVAWGVLS